MSLQIQKGANGARADDTKGMKATYYYLSVLTLVSFSPVTPSSVNPVSD